MQLGVCYYPEHWPHEMWQADAQAMHKLGIQWVRIGEFAWSRIEPEAGQYHWDWLDQAIEILADAGLNIVLGTPTATPPRWLIARYPEILPVGADGQVRGFGSRRHYCFSSLIYRQHSRRIVIELAKRYGQHPAIRAWQTDNEYGCHDTVLSYSEAAACAFRRWLEQRYQTIDHLNQAWGTIFWSQEYQSFGQIDPPIGAVTEANPAQRLDYRRFASDQVVSFNREQVEIIRQYSPGRDIIHNFMGFFTEFDHFKLALDLDVASWDSYPLGFLDERSYASESEKQSYARVGHPDISAFHHDLYRGVGRGRWWVMEQQPGPVNWASYNPAPLPGMVRLWSLEAFAHGAEVVSYFRWRQAPFGQEQMHSGLNLSNGKLDRGGEEARQVAADIALLASDATNSIAPIALIFPYEAKWLLDIQPQGANFDYLEWVFECYSALRQLGLNIDIISPEAALASYQAVVIPSLPILSDGLIQRLKAFTGQLFIGPRSGSKTQDYQIPDNLPPGLLQALLPIQISRVESLRPGLQEPIQWQQQQFYSKRWREHIDTTLTPLAQFSDGTGAVYQQQNIRYLATWPEPKLLLSLFKDLCQVADIAIHELPQGVRLRRHGDLQFVFNFGTTTTTITAPDNAQWLLGQPQLKQAEIAVWRNATE